MVGNTGWDRLWYELKHDGWYKWKHDGLGANGIMMVWVQMEAWWLGYKWKHDGWGTNGSMMVWVQMEAWWLG